MSNTLELFGMNGSTCTQRILVTAEENGAPYHLTLVDLRKGEQKSPEHLARQPFGQIPALQDGDFTIYESRAISRYVNDTRGGKLTPTDPGKRGLMEQWLSLEQGTFDPITSGVVAQRIFAPMFGGKTDEAKVAELAAKATKPFDIMDAHLAKNQYLAGDQFSLADLFYMPYFNLFLLTPEKTFIESRPHIAAWWKRVSERPSWKKILALNEFNQQ